MELVDVTANKTDVKQLGKWLKRDFPLAERTPFRILQSLAKKGGIRFYFAKEGGSVLAYTVLHFFRGYTQVLYLAVMPEGRGRGTGSKLIPLIKEKAGGTLILSGIIKEKLQGVLQAFAAEGFAHIKTVNKGEWYACAFTKNN